MKITKVSIKNVRNSSNLKAFASITIDEEFMIHELRIIEGKNGLFVAMPSKKVGENYIDIAHPITAEARTMITTTVLEAYHQQLEAAV
ncbi:MAG: stage sporulation protein [Clostridia bacterium]|jgi:stage V sporulation protein G|nr:SpoVG family protein [Clostridiales bacterium]MDK2986344.1 stage sporulation protein [Clostridia bacterium]